MSKFSNERLSHTKFKYVLFVYHLSLFLYRRKPNSFVKVISEQAEGEIIANVHKCSAQRQCMERF